LGLPAIGRSSASSPRSARFLPKTVSHGAILKIDEDHGTAAWRSERLTLARNRNFGRHEEESMKAGQRVLNLVAGMVTGFVLAPTGAQAVPSYHALLVGPHYPGGNAFDDTIAGTRMNQFATEMGQWGNWNPANITTLTGVLAANSFLDALTAKQQVVDKDDVFVLIYHGHGDSDWFRTQVLNPPAPKFGNDGEIIPPNGIAANVQDEALTFRSDATAQFQMTDDALGAAMRGFSATATKLVITISCFGGGMWGGGDGDMGPTDNRIAFIGGVRENHFCPEPPPIYQKLFATVENGNSGTISIQDLYTSVASTGAVTGDHWFVGDIPAGVSTSFESMLAGTYDVDFMMPIFFDVSEAPGMAMLGLGLAGLGAATRRRRAR
jgi:hypothetical protein